MRCALALVCAATLMAGCASATGGIKRNFNFKTLGPVAIVEINVAGGTSATRGTIGDIFEAQLLEKGYDVVARTHVSKVIEEQKFQGSSFASSDGAARAGRILNADAVMVISVPELDNQISISARMIQTETGAVLFSRHGSGDTLRGVTTVSSALVGALAGGVIGHEVAGKHHKGTGTVIGATVGGVGAGAIGYALEPSRSKLADEIVRKMCMVLPDRFGD